MSKVKQDSHGLYVICNGSIHRPEKNRFDYEFLKRTVKTSFNVGDVVKVKHLVGTPCSQLRADKVTEVWISHGFRYDKEGKVLKSDTCWQPIS